MGVPNVDEGHGPSAASRSRWARSSDSSSARRIFSRLSMVCTGSSSSLAHGRRPTAPVSRSSSRSSLRATTATSSSCAAWTTSAFRFPMSLARKPSRRRSCCPWGGHAQVGAPTCTLDSRREARRHSLWRRRTDCTGSSGVQDRQRGHGRSVPSHGTKCWWDGQWQAWSPSELWIRLPRRFRLGPGMNATSKLLLVML